MENQELLTIEEMAQRLKVPLSWLYSRTRMKDGDFPVIRVGKYCRFNPDAVMTWIEKKQNQGQHNEMSNQIDSCLTEKILRVADWKAV